MNRFGRETSCTVGWLVLPCCGVTLAQSHVEQCVREPQRATECAESTSTRTLHGDEPRDASRAATLVAAQPHKARQMQSEMMRRGVHAGACAEPARAQRLSMEWEGRRVCIRGADADLDCAQRAAARC
ncbi:hypothetical protein FVE85_2502 [Porphyridium purpureum]|uniref:Secreted protein n=1 Tax=Porphyridium purpureum TaxID=35688 RepID=A0A5J4YM67_PORPP|nr:hypothetical protein FVE85_2502 [Porphyridium purpureum]|eukprot:POR2262..scf291_13